MDNNIKAEPNGLSIAAIVFGIFSILGSFTIIAVPIFAPLAVTFALLSRGSRKMCTQAVVGVTLAVVSVFVGILLSAAVMTYLFSNFGDMYRWMFYW